MLHNARVENLNRITFSDGDEFEEFYINYYDSYDPPSSAGEFSKPTRTTMQNADSALDGISGQVAAMKTRICPAKYNKGFYQSCVKSFFKAKNSAFDQFSSLQSFDTSVYDFLDSDFTSCRWGV